MTSSVEAALVVDRGETVQVEMALRYSVVDAHAVRALFVAGDGVTVEWVFARDLLREGLLRAPETPVGAGDVRVWSAYSGGRPVVVLALSSPSGDAVLEVDMRGVRMFLDATQSLVPFGEESVDVDVILSQIFAAVER